MNIEVLFGIHNVVLLFSAHIDYILLALTRKICGTLSKKLQKLALFKY